MNRKWFFANLLAVTSAGNGLLRKKS